MPEAVEDPRFRDNGARLKNQAALRSVFEPLMAGWDGEELARELMAAGAPAGAVLETHEVVAAPHTLHRKMTVEIDGFRTTGNPIKMSRTPPVPDRLKPPGFGQETRAVLAEIGYSEDEIEAMIAAGAVLDRPKA